MCVKYLFVLLSVFLVLKYTDGINLYNELKLKLYTTPATWQEARDICGREGKSLFIPNKEKQANILTSLMEEHDETLSSLGPNIIWVKGKQKNIHNIIYCPTMLLRENGSWKEYYFPCDRKFAFVCKTKWNQECGMNNTRYTYAYTVGKCYRIGKTPRTWARAREICQSEGSDLAIINSHEEVNYLVGQIGTLQMPGDYEHGVAHLGFHHNYVEDWQTVEGTSLYYSGYACWARNQPGEGTCGSMLYNGYLNAIDCNQKAIFICEHNTTDYIIEPPSGDILRQSLTCF